MKIQMKRFMSLVSILISSSVFADVPYTFTAGMPAKASEVNSNFETLNQNVNSALGKANSNTQSISDINSRVTSLEGAPTNTECEASTNPHGAISYSAKASTIGEQITAGGNNYRIIKVPFVEFSSGDQYTLQYPVMESDSSPGMFFSNFSTQHTNSDLDCINATISGLPTFIVDVYESQGFLLNNTGSTSSSTLSLYASLTIKVNETSLNVTISASQVQSSAQVNNGDYDFTDNLDADAMVDMPSLVSALDSLIDYITVTKEP